MRLVLRNIIFSGVIFLAIALAAPTSASWLELYNQWPDTDGISPDYQALPQPVAQTGSFEQLSTPGLIEDARLRGAIDLETANLYLSYALSNDPRLPFEYQSDLPWDGTLSLLRLKKAVGMMEAGQERAFIETVLNDSCGTNVYSVQTDHFLIHYGAISGGLNITSYATSLEQSWQKQIVDFAWVAPPGGLYHVVISSLGYGLYGYVTSTAFVGDNPNSPWNDSDAMQSCMVLNNNYSYFGNPQKALDATTAHEFNHSIQFGIGALSGAKMPDDNFIEGGATWMEDEVFDGANDNYYYLWPVFSQCMGQYTSSPYPYWVVFRGMTERFGAGVSGGGEQVMQDFWELTSKGISGNLTALNSALNNQGTTLADAFHDLAVAVKFNRSCGGGYVAPYCLEEGPNYVSFAGDTPLNGFINTVGSGYNGQIMNNYAINWVSLPASGYYDVKLQNNASGGAIRGSLVCDTGGALIVEPLPQVVGAGQSTTFSGYSPAGCVKVVAVLTNQSQTAENPSSCTSHSYSLSTIQSESPTATPPPDAVLDHMIYVPLIIRTP